MTNIQKLYELAKVVKYRAINRHNPLLKYGDYNNLDDVITFGDDFDIELDYPPFTAEKQLELIKWLAFERRVSIKFINAKWYLYTAEMGISTSAKYETFEQLLAEFICNMWKDLTEEQREEIRGILQ